MVEKLPVGPARSLMDRPDRFSGPAGRLTFRARQPAGKAAMLS
jgi:hypothetical protein